MDAADPEDLPKLPVLVQGVPSYDEVVRPGAVMQQAALKHDCSHGTWHLLQLCFLLKWQGQLSWKR